MVSEEKSFESVDGRRTEASHTKSSPGAFGSGELENCGGWWGWMGGGGKLEKVSFFQKNQIYKKNIFFLGGGGGWGEGGGARESEFFFRFGFFVKKIRFL